MQAVRFLAMLAASALIGAPLANAEDLEINDTGNFIPSGRLSFDIAPRGERPSVPHTGHGIEIGITGASVDDKQDLGVGDSPVVFGGRVFAAPGELRHELDWRFVEITYRYRHFFGSGKFGIEGLGGLGFAELDLTTSSGGLSASDKLSNGGLVAGFGIIWKFLPSASLQSRLTLFGSGSTEGVTGAARWDVHLAYALGRHAALRAGLVGWGIGSARADDDDESSLNSPLRLGFSGLSLGLDVAF
jgi:hypothetical protein